MLLYTISMIGTAVFAITGVLALGADRLAVWVAPWLMTDVHAEALGEYILPPEVK